MYFLSYNKTCLNHRHFLGLYPKTHSNANSFQGFWTHSCSTPLYSDELIQLMASNTKNIWINRYLLNRITSVIWPHAADQLHVFPVVVNVCDTTKRSVLFFLNVSATPWPLLVHSFNVSPAFNTHRSWKTSEKEPSIQVCTVFRKKGPQRIAYYDNTNETAWCVFSEPQCMHHIWKFSIQRAVKNVHRSFSELKLTWLNDWFCLLLRWGLSTVLSM